MIKSNFSSRHPGAPLRAQRGVVLFIALVVLVAMTLAGLAMFRQVGTGVTIAGNLAFKANATSVADMGVESGRTWLMAQGGATLQSDLVPGYYSSWQAAFNPATFDWTNNATLVTADDGTGNEVRYVVHRMCKTAGLTVNDPNQQCVTIGSAAAGGSRGGGGYGLQALSNTTQPFFRVTVRTAGPRNTVSYVQAIMY